MKKFGNKKYEENLKIMVMDLPSHSGDAMCQENLSHWDSAVWARRKKNNENLCEGFTNWCVWASGWLDSCLEAK